MNIKISTGFLMWVEDNFVSNYAPTFANSLMILGFYLFCDNFHRSG